MEGSIVFYTYGSTLELYGQQFTAGMLTADLSVHGQTHEADHQPCGRV